MGFEGILTNCLRRVHHSCFAHCRLQLYRHTCLPKETEKTPHSAMYKKTWPKTNGMVWQSYLDSSSWVRAWDILKLLTPAEP